MNKSSSSRFNGAGFAIGLAVGVALSGALGPAVMFGFVHPEQC
jgi:hypothetical protein